MNTKNENNFECAEEVREHAIVWEKYASENSLSYGELLAWGFHFERLANKVDLVDEFKENGII